MTWMKVGVGYEVSQSKGKAHHKEEGVQTLKNQDEDLEDETTF